MSNKIETTSSTDTILDPEEYEIAEREAKNLNSSTYIHEFKNPVKYNGTIYDSLTFEWEKLTGKDGLAIENELQALAKPVIVPAFSGDYLIRMAAKACTDKVGADIFLQIPLSDYNKIRSEARSFLLKSEL